MKPINCHCLGKGFPVTIDQIRWTERFNSELDRKVADLRDSGRIGVNSDIDHVYRKQIAEEMYATGASPDESAEAIAMSLVRLPLVEKIRQLTVDRREEQDPVKLAKIDAELKQCKEQYNELANDKVFESSFRSRKPINEGVELPSIMCWGRGYGETSNAMDMSVIDRFNNMVAKNDPYTGQANVVMNTVNRFTANNANKYTADPNPELDAYVDTLFLGDMGPEAFTVNGENPYRLLEKINAGENVDLGLSHGVGIRPQQSPVVAAAEQETPDVNPGYAEAFDDIFHLN